MEWVIFEGEANNPVSHFRKWKVYVQQISIITKRRRAVGPDSCDLNSGVRTRRQTPPESEAAE
jgi:hypothetical protein